MSRTREAQREAQREAPLPRRRVRFETELGAQDLTFPEGHTFAEDAETIVISYKKSTVTIYKADVVGLEILATYGAPQGMEDF